ncbi:MAG TPA: hypothetical protein VK620_26200, partial [Bradyrhizobium sp.]|nr:hypothetical protein [Bradyrhizobium sp.]
CKAAVEVDVGSHELPLYTGPTSTASANSSAFRNDRRSQNSEFPTTNQLLSNLRSATIFSRDCFLVRMRQNWNFGSGAHIAL